MRIGFNYAALNNLDVCTCDIQNAYLQAPSSEKDYIICGPEFGLENVGKRAKIVQALYGGKSAGADYWRHVRKAMEDMGFQSCKSDPDVWLRPAVKQNGTDYYQYVLLYTDYILDIMEEPETFIRKDLFSQSVKIMKTMNLVMNGIEIRYFEVLRLAIDAELQDLPMWTAPRTQNGIE